MGCVPPLGFDVENRLLVINDAEAAVVRRIFEEMLTIGSPTQIAANLTLDGITTKAWTTQDGQTRAGILATNGRVRGNATRAAVPYLLKGIVFGNDGRALSPFHTTKKNGRRYRYYVPQRENKEHAGASGLPRLPAAELESAVLDQLRAVLRSPDLLGDVLPRAIELDPSLDEAKVTVAMTRLDAIWEQLFPAEQTRIVKLLVEKVIVSPNDLEVRLRANGIERLVLELQPAGAAQPEEALA